MVVTVNRDLFGIGYLVNSADLSVGSAGCSVTSSDSVASTVLFSIQLQDCGSSFQVFPDFLSYTNHLYYKPASVGIITRVNIADILLECRYPRLQYNEAIYNRVGTQPRSGRVSIGHPADNWSGPRVSSVIYLGDVLHIEASVAIDNHVPLRLYVDSCITTLSNSKDSEPRYAVVDKLGCLMDSKAPHSSSSFTNPALNKLCFDITSFKFQGDSRSLINMTCKLRAVNADKPASNKACFYQKQTNSWPGPQSACKGDHHRPPDVVHVARDHAVVLSKDSQYHPLQLVEVHDSGSSVSVLAVFTVAQALVIVKSHA
ncbi:UNVERIFIED_CONTAM: hypothetical protein FKN15_017673 [Acipenser sinensis]